MASENALGNALGKDYAGLPGWVWIGVVVAGVGVAYIVPKFFGGSASSGAGTPTDTSANAANGLGLAMDPTTGLPYAVEGLSPSGGVVGGPGGGVDLSSTNNLLQQILSNLNQGPTPSPMPGPGPGPTPSPIPRPSPSPVSIGTNPIIPSGQYHGPSFSNLAPGTKYTYGGVTYTLKAGSAGRLWGINPQGQQVLLYGPPSQYSSIPTTKPSSPASTPARYVTVQRWPNTSSTISDIASRAGISQARLLQLNPTIKNPSAIQPGQQIRIA